MNILTSKVALYFTNNTMPRRIINVQKVGDDIVYQYGQTIDWQSYGWCYMFAFIVWISTLLNIQLSTDWIRQFIQHALGLWRRQNSGGVKEWGGKLVVGYWNKQSSEKVELEECKLFSTKFWVSLKKWLPVVVSIWVGGGFRKDRNDWILDIAEYVEVAWERKIGHAICLQMIWNDIYFIDSRRDQKKYKLQSRKWVESVQGLFKGTNAVIIKKVLK